MSEIDDLKAEIAKLRVMCVPLTDLVQELTLARQKAAGHLDRAVKAEAKVRAVESLAEHWDSPALRINTIRSSAIAHQIRAALDADA